MKTSAKKSVYRDSLIPKTYSTSKDFKYTETSP
jgi:hypothetical protein